MEMITEITTMEKKEELEPIVEINSHYLWRVFFTLMVAFGHSGWIRLDNTSTYIGVDYFFIISGFFLAKSVMTRKYETTPGFTVRRIIKFWPHVIFSFLVYFVFLRHMDTLPEMIMHFLMHLSEILPGLYFVQDVGFMGEYAYNFSTWYLSMLLIVGGGIHYFYRKHRDALLPIAPIVIAICFTYMMQNCSSFNNGDCIGVFLSVYYIRSLAEILCGVILYEVVLRILRLSFSKWEYVIFRFLEGLCATLIIWLMFCHGNSKYDFAIVMLLIILCMLGFMYPQRNSVTAVNKIIRYFSDLMYPVYLNHLFIFYVLGVFGISGYLFQFGKMVGVMLAFSILLLYSILTKWIVERLTKRVQTIVRK